MVRVMALTAPLVALYTVCPASAKVPLTEDILMMAPLFLRNILSTACCAQYR